jgi:hypothetical protein
MTVSKLYSFPNSLFTLGYGSAFIQQSNAGIPGQPDLLVFKGQTLQRGLVDLIGPPVRYHLSHTIEATKCKYGEVDYEQTMRHLVDWSSFYIPGRLHKPFVVLDVQDEAKYKIFQERNKWNRVRALKLAALLASQQAVNDLELKTLFRHLVSLSYVGDVRMRVAENPHKVENIVNGQYKALMDIYVPLMKDAGLTLDGEIVTLPLDKETIESKIVHLARKNRKESIQMAIKGLLTNDLKCSIDYLLRKVKKNQFFM